MNESTLSVPAPVRPGGRIRVVSPTGTCVTDLPERFRRAERALGAGGYRVDYGFVASRVTAGPATAAERARELMEAFADPDVDAVLAADAGHGTLELLEHLDAAVLAAHPKPFIGFCDNVFINAFLASRARLSSLYGCGVIPQLGEAGDGFPETLGGLAAALDSGRSLSCRPAPDRAAEAVNWYNPEADARPRRRCVPGGWQWPAEGAGTGFLYGAEISILADVLRDFECFGRPLEEIVLFWHKAFKGADARDAFRDLSERHDLSRLAGMIIGAHPGIPPALWAATVADLLDEVLPDAPYPIVVNADISHLNPTWVVPYGEAVRLDSAGTITFARAGGAQ